MSYRVLFILALMPIGTGFAIADEGCHVSLQALDSGAARIARLVRRGLREPPTPFEAKLASGIVAAGTRPTEIEVTDEKLGTAVLVAHRDEAGTLVIDVQYISLSTRILGQKGRGFHPLLVRTIRGIFDGVVEAHRRDPFRPLRVRILASDVFNHRLQGTLRALGLGPRSTSMARAGTALIVAGTLGGGATALLAGVAAAMSPLAWTPLGAGIAVKLVHGMTPSYALEILIPPLPSMPSGDGARGAGVPAPPPLPLGGSLSVPPPG